MRLLRKFRLLREMVGRWRTPPRRVANIPQDIIDLLPDAYEQGPALDRWVQRYESALEGSHLSRQRYEHVIFGLLAITGEPTVAIEGFRIVSREYVR